MGSIKSRRTRVKRAATVASASALVSQMQEELHGLVARQRDITRRIRSVHRVMRGLREMASAWAVNPILAGPQPSTNDGTIAGPHQPQTSGTGLAFNVVSLDLQRACRIALMEAQTAVSLEEIYDRIVRRGSFSFADIDHARLPLGRVLNAMTREGEAQLLENSPSERWERILQPERNMRSSTDPSRDHPSTRVNEENQPVLG